MSNKAYYEAIATLIGCVIGAGVLGIPYVVAKAGLFIGIIDILIIGIIILYVNLCVGEIVLRTKGAHQLSGYANIYLGKLGKEVMAIIMVIGIYASLIAYLIGEVTSLNVLLGISPLLAGIMFFIFVSIILFVGLKAVEKSELYITSFMILFVLLLVLLSFGSISVENFSGINLHYIFLPYGVILFSFLGTAAVPEMAEMIKDDKGKFKKALILGSLIPLIIYIVFTIIVIGVVGMAGFEVIPGEKLSTLALGATLGSTAFILSNLFAICAMATSFIAVSVALKEMFNYDYKLSRISSWVLTLIIPLAVFIIDLLFLDVGNFIRVLSVGGSFAGGVLGILVMLMVTKAVKNGDRKPEYSLPKPKILQWIVFIVFTGGLVYELLRIAGIIIV